MGSEKPMRSASAIVAGTESGQHLLKIVGYSRTKEQVPTGEHIKSRSFRVGGHSWHIRYYPNGVTTASSDNISIYLELENDVPDGVRAQYTFSLLDQLGGKPVPRFTAGTSAGQVKIFRYPSLAWGYGSFISREELEKSEHLSDDSFTIRCDVTVMKDIHTKDIAVDVGAGAAPPAVVVPPPDFHRHLASLLTSGEGTDIAFEVDGKTFTAHRLVLAARSPALLALVKAITVTDGGGAVVRIEDMEAQDFEAFLHYVYTDTLPETTTTAAMLPDLVAAANRYKMERLRLLCEDKMCEFLNVRTVAVMLEFSMEHHCHGLKEACLRFLHDTGNLREVVKVNGLEHLTESCPSVLKDIIAKLAAGP